MKKTLEHTAPPWLDPLEKAIAPAVFRYELARRTPEGRKRKLPRWDKVPPQVRLALRRMLSSTRPRRAWTLEPSPGYYPLTISTLPFNLSHQKQKKSAKEVKSKTAEGIRLERDTRTAKQLMEDAFYTAPDRPVFLDLHQPDAVLLKFVKIALRHLRAKHKIRARRAPANTRGESWGWIDFLDKPRGLDDTDRATLSEARARGEEYLSNVLLCFDHPAEIVRQYDAQLFQKPK
jgi:hypothetical protein